MREFLASWYLVLVFQNKRDLKSNIEYYDIQYAADRTFNCYYLEMYKCYRDVH